LSQTIAGQVASVIDNARLHQSVKSARDVAERELEIGRQIQTSFFPDEIPDLDGWKMSAYFKSARQVAGDFYDVFTLEKGGKLGLVLADVCDKGVGAALFMVLFRSLLRANLIQGFSDSDEVITDPGRVLVSAIGKTNNYIANNHAKANMFATVFAVVMEQDNDNLWYINCGHDSPVLIRNSGTYERIKPNNAAIGMFADLNLSSDYLTLEKGESIVAFTDGVTDARSLDGEVFGDKRLLEVLQSNYSLNDRFDSLKEAINSHIGNADQYDDVTFVGFERNTSNKTT